MTKTLLVMISCEDKGQAERIGEMLLKKKLAACIQVVDHVDSIFFWKKRMDYAEEALLLVKTLDSKWSALEKEVIASHSYENPEIIAIPLTFVTKKYLAWMEHEL